MLEKRPSADARSLGHGGVLCFDAFTLDIARQSLRRGDEGLALRPQSFDVLRHLAEHAGTVVSKDDLIEAVWNNRPASDDSVVQCIADIRQALGKSARDIIKTVSKRGYLFAAEVARGPADPQWPAASVEPEVAAIAPPPASPSTRAWRRILAVALLVAALAAGVSASYRLLFPVPEVLTMMAAPSVAVLPFKSPGDVDHPRSIDTLADDVAIELGRVSGGIPIAVTFASALRGTDASADPPLEKLGTRYVVLGSVHGDGGNRRVNIRLVETRSGQSIWAQPFDYPAGESEARDRAAVQIARLIAHQLLMTESRRPLPADPSADDYALLGRAVLSGERGAKANADARDLFERGYKLNPDSIPVLLGLARTIVDDVTNGWSPADQRSALLDRAEAAIHHAIDLDQRSVGGHFLRGVLARARQDNDQAIAAFQHTLDLNPNFPHAYAELGRALIEVGRAVDAIAPIEKAARLSPTDPSLYIWCYWAGMAAVHAGDYEAAAHWLQRAREANRAYDNTLLWLALAYAGAGRTAEARPLVAEFLASRPQFTIAHWALRPPYRHPIVAQQRVRIAAMLLELGVPEGRIETGASH